MTEPARSSMVAAAAWWRSWQHVAIVAMVCALLAYLGVNMPESRWEKLGEALAGFGSTTVGAGIYAALGALVVAVLRWAISYVPTGKGGGSGGAALLLALCLAPALSGCGATALETQATGVTVALRLVDAAQDAYSADLDSRMGGCTDDACITAARASGQPVEAALDTTLVAVRAWGAAVAVAADVDAGGAVPAVVLSALARVLSLWDELEAALRAYGVAVPPEVGHAIAFLAALAGAT